MKAILPIDDITTRIRELLIEHKEEIEEIYMHEEEEETGGIIGEGLTISLSAKFSIKDNNNICEVAMAFSKGKVKDSWSFVWNEKQKNLFDDKQNGELKS
jgi:hypothetical protein